MGSSYIFSPVLSVTYLYSLTPSVFVCTQPFLVCPFLGGAGIGLWRPVVFSWIFLTTSATGTIYWEKLAQGQCSTIWMGADLKLTRPSGSKGLLGFLVGYLYFVFVMLRIKPASYMLCKLSITELSHVCRTRVGCVLGKFSSCSLD